MAKFVTLERDGSGEIIHLNADYIVHIEQAEKYSIVRMAGVTDMKVYTVVEKAIQILDQIKRV